MNHHNTCLNCATEVSENYCYNCGQSSHTHRLSLQHFVAHDVIHGVLHLDKGLIFTIKKVMTRPSYAAMEYIAGKRKSYYNFFYLILLLVGFYSLIGKFYGQLFPALDDVHVDSPSAANDFLHNYSKLILIGFVPVISLNSLLLYRKVKLNYLEHIIVSVLAFIGVLIVFIIARILEPLELLNIAIINSLLSWGHIVAILIYTNLSFYQAFKDYYSKKKMLIRFLLFFFLVSTEVILFFVFLLTMFGGTGTIYL